MLVYLDTDAFGVVAASEADQPLDEVLARKLDELGRLPSVGTAVAVELSLAYAAMFENRRIEPSDAADVRHAIMASATEAFVTEDDSLRTGFGAFRTCHIACGAFKTCESPLGKVLGKMVPSGAWCGNVKPRFFKLPGWRNWETRRT